jgi:hypothetical protein
VTAWQGNQLFLEEMARALVETGGLVGQCGDYHPAEQSKAIVLPATVQDVIAARIDRLPPQEKRLLQTAAVIGRVVPYDLLQAIRVQDDTNPRDALAALEAGEFLYQTCFIQGRVYLPACTDPTGRLRQSDPRAADQFACGSGRGDGGHLGRKPAHRGRGIGRPLGSRRRIGAGDAVPASGSAQRQGPVRPRPGHRTGRAGLERGQTHRRTESACD